MTLACSNVIKLGMQIIFFGLMVNDGITIAKGNSLYSCEAHFIPLN
jgi:hypothetical protein